MKTRPLPKQVSTLKPMKTALRRLFLSACLGFAFNSPSRAADGLTWSTQPSGTSATLRGISAPGGAAVAVGENRTILQYQSGGWQKWSVAEEVWEPASSLYSVAAVAPDDIWVGSYDNPRAVSHWNGTEWSTPTAFTPTHRVESLWAGGADLVVASGNSARITQWNGTQWTNSMDGGAGVFTSVHGSASTNIWAVASSGQIWNSANGAQTWTQNTAPLPLLPGGDTPRWQGVFTLHDSTAWLVGDRAGEIYFWDGEAFELQLNLGSNIGFYDIHAEDENNVWAVGSGGRIYYFNGEHWEQVAAGLTTETLYAIAGDGNGGLFVVGSSGVILRAIPEAGASALLLLGAGCLLLAGRLRKRCP